MGVLTITINEQSKYIIDLKDEYSVKEFLNTFDDHISRLRKIAPNESISQTLSATEKFGEAFSDIKELFNQLSILIEALGKDISKIDGKAFYSCWQLQNVFIDDANPYYCDLDGVIYTKDLTEIIYYPSDHDRYLRLQKGYAYIDEKGEQHSNLLDDDGKEMEELWEPTEKYDEAYFNEYNKLVRTYVVPSTVTTIGQLAFAYSNITDLYVPEGLQKIETMGIFKNTILLNVYSYTTDNEISDTSFNAISSFKTQYNSLPEGLEYIGSDAFTYNSSLTYLYIPDSVTYIGHHAFWNTVYKKDGNLKGITEINVASDEDSFKSNCKLGDDWKPKYDYKLFKKAVDVNFSATRED